MVNKVNCDELYHSCRWCKYWDGKKCVCTNDRAFDELDDNVLYPFWEDGHLSEAIREGFKNFKFAKLEAALIESKLSKKRVKEIMEIFNAELELDAQMNWTESIDDAVSTALNNFDFGADDGIPIKDPEDFYCKYFW
jgi:hypothetical protein